MDKDQYLSLYEKFLAGNCSDQEQETLLRFQDQFELKEYPWDDKMGNHNQVKEAIFDRLLTSIKPKSQFIYTYSIAASLAFLLLFGAYYKFHSVEQTNTGKKRKYQTYSSTIVKPGSDKAILTLADGSKIVLGKKNGVIITNNGINIRQDKKGQLICIVNQIAHTTKQPSLNTISTPTGGQYQITLEDGTKAWLNAGSSLSFPSFFSGTERNISVTGEVYFEVAKNKSKPFTLSFNGNKITVLGTHFNIMAYKEEPKSKITLIEGSVKLSNSLANTLLYPGMQALVNSKTNTITIRKANIEEAIAWKNGYFMFENENIHSIMRKISRWYDVEVIYRGNMTGKEFSGTVSRFDDVSEALHMLELTGSINFKLKERRIEVMP